MVAQCDVMAVLFVQVRVPSARGRRGQRKLTTTTAIHNNNTQQPQLQERIRNDIAGWLAYLKTVGFDGWRFDFVRGYGGQFVKAYVDATVPQLAFGEYWDSCDYSDGVLNYNQGAQKVGRWAPTLLLASHSGASSPLSAPRLKQPFPPHLPHLTHNPSPTHAHADATPTDNHRQRTINWCDQTGGTAAAFDFTTKGILQEALGRGELWRLVDAQGRPPGVVGMWASRAITFIDNVSRI